jgi:hypothetical protein
MENPKPQISKIEAKHELWRRGELLWKLDQNQKDLYKLFHNSDHIIQTWLLARRSGKTYTLLVLAFEALLRKPRTIVKFLAPTRLQVQTIIRPLIQQITEDCPPDLTPEFKTQDYIYYFPNGSELQLAGSENKNVDKLRGGECTIAIIDETQDVSDLDYAINSVLLPTTLTTNGKILMAGTPPKEMDHEFINYIKDAEFKGSLIRRTVYDNPRITVEQLEKQILSQYPQREKAEAFRREFLCEIIKDENRSVIPEFNDDLKKEIIREWATPPYFDCYVSMDLGAVDLTAVLFGYFDFRASKLVVQDELVVDFSKKDMNIERLTQLIKEKEEFLWTNALSNEVKKPHLRVSDINLIVTQEIAVKSFGQIYFSTTRKDDKEAAINHMRTLIGGQKIIINPRCKNLIKHLDNVIWASNKNKIMFGRSPDNGHYDCVDALIYLCRNVNFSKNPFPANYDLGGGDVFIPNRELHDMQKMSKAAATFNKLFGRKNNTDHMSSVMKLLAKGK